MEQNCTFEINANLKDVEYSRVIHQCSLWWLGISHRIDPYVQNILRRIGVTVKGLPQHPATDEDYAEVLNLLDNKPQLVPLLNNRAYRQEFIESLHDPWITTHMLIKATHLA